MLTTIQNSIHDHGVIRFKLVINGVRKAFGQQPMKAKDLPMNPGVKRQRIYIRKK